MFAVCEAAECINTLPDWACVHFERVHYCAASYSEASYVKESCPVTCR